MKKIIKNISVMVLIITIIGACSSTLFGKKNEDSKQIVVYRDETIWSIAKDICKNNSSLNVQNIVYEIKDLNNMTSSIIYEGQELIIPVY